MPIFKIQRMSDGLYLCKNWWVGYDKAWKKDGHIFSTYRELRLTQNRIRDLCVVQPDTYGVVTYDLENMVKRPYQINEKHQLELAQYDKLGFSFGDFLPLTKQAKMLKLGFVNGQTYEVNSVLKYGTDSCLHGYQYREGLIELRNMYGLFVPYCLFSKI